jgi:carbon storage regulator
MLVIRRKQGESLRVGEDVEIAVIEVSATRVVLGIQAPPSVVIVRTELLEAAEQNLAAAQSAKIFSPANISSYLTKIRR